MTNDPDILTDFGSATTNAAPNTSNNTTILGPIAAANAIRVWSVQITPRPNTTGNIRVRCQGNASPSTVGILATTAGNGGHLEFFPQGVLLPVGESMNLSDISNVASQTYDYVVLYTVDQNP